MMKAAEREIIVDEPNDKESLYDCDCDCGFSRCLSETCSCDSCLCFNLPLVVCPDCGTEFTIVRR
jgi:hypothetical protein